MDLLLIAEQCLHDLRKARALRMAPFSPGDQVIATLELRGFPATEVRYAIWDVEPDSRNLYCYQAIAITKAGALSKRLNIQPLSPDRFSLRVCDAPLDGESARALEWRREVRDRFLDQTVDVGSLDVFMIEETGWSGRRSVKRRS